MKSFGQNLKKYRKLKSMSQKSLAQYLDIGQTTIGNYEKSIRFPKVEILKKLSNVLDISIDDLVGKTKLEPIKFDIEEKSNIFIALIFDDKEQEAIQMITEIAKSGYDVIELYHHFLEKTLYYVGDQWQRGELSISMEYHIISVIEQLISQLAVYIHVPNWNKKTAIFMAPVQEAHLIGLKIIKETFRKYGWKTIFVGNSVPWKDLLQTIDSNNVNLVCISMTISNNINQTEALINYIRDRSNVEIMLGGQAFEFESSSLEILKPNYYANSNKKLISLLNAI